MTAKSTNAASPAGGVSSSSKTLNNFADALTDNNGRLQSVEARMESLLNRLHGTDSPNADPPKDCPAGVVPRISGAISDATGSISRIEDMLSSLESIA